MTPSAPACPESWVVIDFETTGMGPQQGARATEIAAVKVQAGRVVGHYQSLMRTGVPVPYFIQQLTGITDAMLREAPPAEEVMAEVLAFAAGCPLVAHNAAFDRLFWQAEAARVSAAADPAHADFACTLLLSRRLWPDAPNHRLSTLGDYCGFERNGQAHRALSDAELTARILLRLQKSIERQFEMVLQGQPISHTLLCQLQRTPKHQLAQAVARSLPPRQPG